MDIEPPVAEEGYDGPKQIGPISITKRKQCFATAIMSVMSIVLCLFHISMSLCVLFAFPEESYPAARHVSPTKARPVAPHIGGHPLR